MTEYRTLLSNFIKKSATIGLLRNDGTVDTTDYVSTSNTEGLIKNDGTIDTTNYVNTNDSRLSDTRNPKPHTHLSSNITDLIEVIYPVGSIYMSINSTDPSTLFGGSWTRLKDTFLLACGDTYSSDGDVATSKHGSATVTLTANQSGLKAHGHGMDHNHNHRHNLNKNFSTGSGGSTSAYITSANRTTSTQYTGYDSTASSKKTTDNNTASNASEAHENMPPYMAVYMWKRTG